MPKDEVLMTRMIKDLMLAAFFIARLPFIGLMMFLFRTPQRAAGPVSKILIVRLDRIGDLILSIPVIDNLRLKYPSAKITLLVRPYLMDLAMMIQGAANVKVYYDIPHNFNAIRSEKYDIAIDMHYDYKLEPALIAYLSGAPVRVGFAWGGRELLLTNSVKATIPPGKHMVETGLDLLRAIDVPVTVTVPKLIPPPSAIPSTKLVVVHPGGYYESQRWPAPYFAEMVKRMIDELNEVPILIGGPDDRELVYEILSAGSERCCKVAFPNMRDLIEILADSKLLVCNNSGPVHLAAALGVPTVSTMGPTDPVLWWPVGPGHIVVRKGKKVSDITVDEMFEAVKKALEGKG